MIGSKTQRSASLAVVLALGLSACSVTRRIIELDFYDAPDSRIENLDRLHTARTGHHYSANFVGDFQQYMGRERRSIGGVTIGAPGSGSVDEGTPKPLPNPSEACLRLLGELLDFDSSENPRLAATQVAWCARIIDEDPSFLSRERATLGLGPIAKRIGIAGPVNLALDAPRANADQTAELLTELIASWRGYRDGTGSLQDLEEDLASLQATTFDLDGSRRVLLALAGLLAGVKAESPGYPELVETLEDFERRTIQFSLARSLTGRRGPTSHVRAAAVSASVEAGGAEMLARFMSVLQEERQAGPERDPILVFRILNLLGEYGFPESFAGLDEERYEEIREGWYDLMIGFAVEDLEGRIRVKAMQALTRTTDGPGSLREEEWEEWYYARVEARRAREGLPPTLKAAEASGDSGS